MRIEVHRVEMRVIPVRARIPFKYGVATMIDVPHLLLYLEASLGGQRAQGVSADLLPPKWFNKDPQQSLPDELREMYGVIAHAAQLASGASAESAFELWRQLYQCQLAWAQSHSLPPLLAGFGASLVERALLEAVCRALQLPFRQALSHPAIGLRLEKLRPELAGAPLLDSLGPPLETITVRHTVGLGDALSPEEIPPSERLSDGLPQSLTECLQRYQLRHFKIKLRGQIEPDLQRLRGCLEIISRGARSDFAFSLDGNEQFASLEQFREFWTRLSRQSWFQPRASNLLFVEQPLPRAHSLEPHVAPALSAWPDAPPLVIDESDAELSSLPRALELGYAGCSHKNCKGIFKGLANAALLRQHARKHPQKKVILTGEDLCNIGPIALQQDLLLMATLGIASVERNGHHYCPGLSMFPEPAQQMALRAHPDLYEISAAGWPTVRIRHGQIRLSSILSPPFAVGFEMPWIGRAPAFG